MEKVVADLKKAAKQNSAGKTGSLMLSLITRQQEINLNYSELLLELPEGRENEKTFRRNNSR